jgi:hypothetical protein
MQRPVLERLKFELQVVQVEAEEQVAQEEGQPSQEGEE